MLIRVYYSFLFIFGPLLSVLSLLSPKLKNSFKERSGFGEWSNLEFFSKLSSKKIVWVHAASVGEVNGIAPLVHEFLGNFPNSQIIVSTTSQTGKEKAESLGFKAALLPFDYPGAVSRVISKIKPSLVIINETEIWPILFHELQKRNIPLALVNARISNYAWPKYRALKLFFSSIISKVLLISCQNEQDKERYLELGARDEVVSVTGSTKYDNILNSKNLDSKELILGLFENGPVLVAGSVHPGEWETVVDSFLEAKNEIENLQLIIAPRHLEKTHLLESYLKSKNLDFNKRSSLLKASDKRKSILVLDTLGELNLAYKSGTLAFVGGTLVQLGGHNPLEPASFGLPVLLGPNYSNVENEVLSLKNVGVSFVISSKAELKGTIIQLLSSPDGLVEIKKNASSVVAALKGASKTNIALLSVILSRAQQSNFSNKFSIKSIFLSILSLPYTFVTKLRNLFYDKNYLKSYSSSLPVICVGNVTVGGSGKTPITAFFSELLIHEGRAPVILSRGYKGAFNGPHLVLATDRPENVGDEALMQAKNLKGKVKVVISKDRAAGAKFIEEKKLGDIILLDDGFQHRRLVRDLNIALVDLSEEDFIHRWSSKKLLPAGRFREEPHAALERSNLIIFVIRKWLDSTESIKEKVTFFNNTFKPKQIAFLELKPGKAVSLVSGNEIDISNINSASVLTALANPFQFIAMLKAAGVQLSSFKIYPDHFSWSKSEIDELTKTLPSPIVTTEKDAAKLEEYFSNESFDSNLEIWVPLLKVDYFGKETERVFSENILKVVNR